MVLRKVSDDPLVPDDPSIPDDLLIRDDCQGRMCRMVSGKVLDDP